MREMSAEILRMLLRPELYHSVLMMFADFSKIAASILLTALWQGIVIAVFLAICLRVAPRIAAGLRFLLLAGGFAAIVALPFLPMLAVRITHSAGNESSSAVVSAVSAHPWLMIDARWSVALTVLWLAASLWRGVDLGVHSLRLRSLWKNAQPVTDEIVSLPKLRGRRRVELCTTEALERPSVIGFLAPRILIPTWLLKQMSQTELEQIVLHETEHLRRGDDWTNLLQKLSLVLFPLNPALLWMERRLCLEREMACDEGVVRRTRAPRAYAACLTNLAGHSLERREQALSLGAWQRRPELARRVHSLLAKKPALRPAIAGSVVVVLGCGVLAGSAELARCPQMIGFAAPAVSRPARNIIASTAMEGDRVLRPEFIPALATATSQPHMTTLRAEMPVRDESIPLHRTLPRIHTMPGARQEAPATHAFPASAAPREQLLKASTDEARTTHLKSNAEQAQGWVVMTAMWEQTETAPSAIVSDTAETQNQDAVQQPARQTSQITVTRLVFRVASPDSAQNSTEAKDPTTPTAQHIDKYAQSAQSMPAFVPVRDGWLILQL
jgi:beta-lactamase regulating signal transducer with metallopeptidase domain